MSTVEAAASLFGPSDSGSEFLTAPESADSASQSPTGESKSNGMFPSQNSSDLSSGVSAEAEATSLFSADNGGHKDFGGAIGNKQEGDLPWEGQSLQSSRVAAQENKQDAYYNGDYYNDGQTHWHGHVEQRPADNGNTGYYDSYASSSDQYGYLASEEPYTDQAQRYAESTVGPSNVQDAPSKLASEYGPSPAVQQPSYDYSMSNSSTSVYDRYNPSHYLSQHSQSTSSPIATPNGPYEPYKPSVSQRNVQSAVTHSIFTPPLASAHPSILASTSSSISTMEAPKSPAPPFRPTKYDAYDPPLPAAKPKRSTTTHLYQQSPVSPSQYAFPPPPRPPLRASTFTPDAGSRLLSSPPHSSRASVTSHQNPAGRPPPPSSVVVGHPEAYPYNRSPQHYPLRDLHTQEDPYAPSTQSDSYGLPPSSTSHIYSPETSKEDYGHALSVIGHSQPNKPVALANDSQRASNVFQQSLEQSSGSFEPDISLLPPIQESFNGYHPYSLQSDAHVYKDAPRVSSPKPSSPAPVKSRPTSPPRRSLDSPPTQRSPENPKDISPIQRGFSPASESGRSWTGSQGRSSRPASRQGPLLATQCFASLDDQIARHGEPYNFVPRNISRVSSPDGRSLLGTAVPPTSVATTSLTSQDRIVVDLASDTSSTYGRSSSPALSIPQHQDKEIIPTMHSSQMPKESASSPSYDPYKPKQPQVPRTMSPPSAQQYHSNTHAPAPPLAYRQDSYDPPIARERSMSNLSAASTFSTRSVGLYVPPHPPGQNDIHRNGTGYNLQATPGQQLSYGLYSQPVTSDRLSSEKPYSPPPITGPYAPSPSLLGTNDPLGRAGAKVPVISFGFGGKLITCFHSPPALNTGFDVALSSRKCTDVHIRLLHKVIPESALETSIVEYPGPLFGDPGSPVIALVRNTTSTNTKAKTKKAKVLAYLEERAEELQRAIGYLSAGTIDRRRADGKLVIVRLLHALVEYDGQLLGSPEVENAVRTALLPNLEVANANNASIPLASTGVAIASGAFGSALSNERPIGEYSIRPSALKTIQQFLYRGEKRKAYHFALDEKMWAHAMVIAGSIDKDAYKEAVNEFVTTELGFKNNSQTTQFTGRSQAPVINSYEPLCLAYTLYSGQSSAAVQQLLSTTTPLENGSAITLQPPAPMSRMTPLTPNFPSPELAGNVPPDVLNKWPEYAAILYSAQMGAESSSALTTLGDYLRKNGWIEAAHCCYLLSPQSSPIGGVGTPAVRIVLVGSQSPQDDPLCSKDPDGFMFSEIVEFALGLHSPAKGQEPFAGFPHLQAYRLVHALQLAEMGHVPLAKRYCDAISASSIKSSPYLSVLFSEKLKELSNRLTGDPELDKSKAWIGGKIAKPSFDWIGDTLSRLVTGEAEGSQQQEDSMPNNPAYAGAFSQYSNISSTNTSKSPSPAPSFVNGGPAIQGLPKIPESVAGVKNLTNAFNPVNRASSAWDYNRTERKNTPPPRVTSAGAVPTSFAQSQSFSQAMDSYTHNSSENAIGAEQNGTKSQYGGGWWNQTSAYDSSMSTPTATTFVSTETSVAPSSDGFISLMDSAPSFTPPASSYAAASSKQLADDDFDDDLGLSNSSSRHKQEHLEDENKPAEKTETPKEGTKKPDPKPAPSSSSSWFGRLFSRSSSSSSSSPPSTSGPVKANLGEENAFYFDKELGKWVNKKAGVEPSKPAAPHPPPSRAQTASPSKVSAHAPASRAPPSPMPPPRPASAMEPNMAPFKRPVAAPKIHSNLVPDGALSAPPTPAVISSMNAAPPTGRSKSAATKRNVRSRYVDVFSAPPQENS